MDTNVDKADLLDDFSWLRKELYNISDNKLIIDNIATMLAYQEIKPYISLVVPNNSVLFDSTRISYIRTIGSGSFGTGWGKLVLIMLL